MALEVACEISERGSRLNQGKRSLASLIGRAGEDDQLEAGPLGFMALEVACEISERGSRLNQGKRSLASLIVRSGEAGYLGAVSLGFIALGIVGESDEARIAVEPGEAFAGFVDRPCWRG